MSEGRSQSRTPNNDPQQDRVYCAQSLALGGSRPDLPNEGAARSVVAAYVGSLGLADVAIEFRAAPTRPRTLSAEYDSESRVITLDPPPLHELLIAHEMAHVATPTPDNPHGPEFARTFLDLVDRNVRLIHLADELRVCLLVFRVKIDPGPGRWSAPLAGLDRPRLQSLENASDPLAQIEMFLRLSFARSMSPDSDCTKLLSQFWGN
jgi:hypothetical protein